VRLVGDIAKTQTFSRVTTSPIRRSNQVARFEAVQIDRDSKPYRRVLTESLQTSAAVVEATHVSTWK
jgi:hypothetical protein